MASQLETILEEARERLEKAASTEDAEQIRVNLLGKKGRITELLKSMKEMSPEERKEFGKEANQTRAEIDAMLKEKAKELHEKAMNAKFEKETIDVTEPGKQVPIGAEHPISMTIDEITDIFMSMGFSVAEGPEVETVFYNFDALNAGPNHPARDMSDTFYITEDTLLRTQTSPVQVRTLEKQRPPIKVISPGRCFRCDTPDATHSPMFHQVEGLLVDEGITMADLKGVLDEFAKRMFGKSVTTKFRPHHFPFTEPQRWMYHASNAEARDAESARVPAG